MQMGCPAYSYNALRLEFRMLAYSIYTQAYAKFAASGK